MNVDGRCSLLACPVMSVTDAFVAACQPVRNTHPTQPSHAVKLSTVQALHFATGYHVSVLSALLAMRRLHARLQLTG